MSAPLQSQVTPTGAPANDADNDDATTPKGSPSVRFATTTEEIPQDSSSQLDPSSSRQLEPGTEAELRQLSQSMQGVKLQQERLKQSRFEPVSLPASRVHSHEDSSGQATRQHTQSTSGRPSPRSSSMHSPPLTPAATKSRDGATQPSQKTDAVEAASAMTPQTSPPSSDQPSATAPSSRPGSSGQTSLAPTSTATTAANSEHHHHGAFSIGPNDDASVPVSREPSPSRTASIYTRPFTPAGDANDPYSAANRPPQSKHIDPRFIFSRNPKKTSPSTSVVSLPRSLRGSETEKRHKKDGHSSMYHEDSSATLHSRQGSMAELKRFMKFGKSNKKRTKSPEIKPTTQSQLSSKFKHTGELPFGDDHGLASKYGKFGKVLGAGAGGSVRIIKRSNDGVTFAVKEFRARHSYETEREYAKKVTAEFCIGSTLHHGNIIETLDIVYEKGKWYEVMEYAPYDLFAIVMTGKMSKPEISCSFLQILSGVTYLHSMGLAHRDLKLDNVVVNEYGIMKIIDFGSASVFKYPFENDVVLASGIVGSDPYLAPEVYDERKYDPQAADIWSLAIIFCCMSLRRFPWKMPRVTDNSFKLFSSPPTPGTELRGISAPSRNSKSTNDLPNSPERDIVPMNNAQSSKATEPSQPSTESTNTDGNNKPEVIKGPWRLLRLLPRETRFIIGRMLQIDPKNRAKMDEILEDEWVANSTICQQLEGGRIIRAEGHEHTLEPSAPPPAK